MTDDENGEYLVLINDEGQYSLWPAFKDIPRGWTAVGPSGRRKECLDYIEANWTDMRPKSLRALDAESHAGTASSGDGASPVVH